MTRLLQCGWETGGVDQLGVNIGATWLAPTVVSATPAPRSGVYCLKCGNGNGSQIGWGNASRQIFAHASKTELYYAFGVYRNDTETNSFPSRAAFYTFDTAGLINNFLTFEDDGSCRAYYVTAGSQVPTAQTLIGTSSISIPNNTWTLIEVHIIIATGATGTYEVKINGVSAMSVATVRTAQTNANIGGFGLQFIRIASGSGSSSSYLAFDDIRVNDTSGSVNNTWCGDESIIMVRPTSAGDSTQFTRGGADSGNNYGQVDEAPPNALTDYVYSSTVGHLDLYNCGTTTITSISAIDVMMQMFNPDGSGGSVHIVTKTGAGQSDGSAEVITGVPLIHHRLLEADPADAAAWSQAKLDALQVGVKVAS